MARYHRWGRAVDSFGNIQIGQNIKIYLAGLPTPAKVYTAQSGGSAIETIPQVTTDSSGRFDFWVDSADYELSQLFDIVVGTLKYTDVDIFDIDPSELGDLRNRIFTHITSAGIHMTTDTTALSAASIEQDNRLQEQINSISLSAGVTQDDLDSVSAASIEQDNRNREYTNVQILSVSAASVEQDDRLSERIDSNDIDLNNIQNELNIFTLPNSASQTDILSLSAASVEQDNRVREYAAGFESPSGNIINRANEYTDTQIVSVSAASDEKDNRLHEFIDDLQFELNNFSIPNSASSFDILSVSAASVEQDNRLQEQTNSNISDINSLQNELNTFTLPNSASQTDINNVSAASVEQDNRVREYTDTQILSVSAASREQNQRNIEYTDNVSAASVEQDNREREFAQLNLNDIRGRLLSHFTSGAGLPIDEDLTTYTEVDSASDITITTTKADFSTMQRTANSYVYKDFGAGYFGDFEIQFEAEITATSDTLALAMVIGVSNTAGSYSDMDTANDGMVVYIRRNGANMETTLVDHSGGPASDMRSEAGSTLALRYYTLKRVTNTLTLDIYSDSGRTTLVQTLTIGSATGLAKRYLHVLASHDVAGTANITGYTQNFSGISETSGDLYHITESSIDIGNIGVSAHAHPRYADITYVDSVSAASVEQDNRQTEYTNVQIDDVRNRLFTHEVSAKGLFDNITGELRTLELSAHNRFNTDELALTSIQNELNTLETSAKGLFDEQHNDLITHEVSAGARFLSIETSAAEVIRANIDRLEPTGFVGFENIELTFDNGTRTLTIDPINSENTFSYYIRGTKYTKSGNQTFQISDENGLHFIYYKRDETIDEYVVSPPIGFDELNEILTRNAYIAVIYWDSDNSKQIYLGEETHGLVQDSRTHAYLHFTRGAQLESGGGLGDILADENGNLNPHCLFSNEATVLWDENLRHEISARTVSGALPVYYRVHEDSLNHWRVDEDSIYPVLNSPSGDGRAVYNELTIDGNWKRTEIGTTNHVLAHVFVYNDETRQYGVIMGQEEYGSIGSARDGAPVEINNLILEGLPFQEFKFLGTLIIQSRDSNDNVPKSRIRSTDTGADYIDFRQQSFAPGGSSLTVLDHGSLAGLGDQDHGANSIFTFVSGFGGILNGGDTDVQKALDTLDDHLHDDRYYTETEVDGFITSVSGSSVEQDNRLQEQIDAIDISAILSVSAASIEQDNRLSERIDSNDIDIDGLQFELNTFTLPNSASQTDILSLSAASVEQDNRLQEQIDLNDIDIDSLQNELNTFTLPNSASQSDLNDIRFDLNNFSIPNSASSFDITSVSAASVEQDNRLQEQIDLIDTSSVSAASVEQDNRLSERIDLNVSNIDGLQNELNTFTLPNSASQSDLNDIRYDLNNFSLPTSASQADLNVLQNELNTFTLPNSASSFDITNVSAASVEQDNRIYEDIHDHIASGYGFESGSGSIVHRNQWVSGGKPGQGVGKSGDIYFEV